MFALITLGLLALIAGISLLGCALVNTCLDFIDKRREEQHPKLYKMFEEVHEIGSEICLLHNKQILPLKQKIDRILAETPYFPEAEKISEERVLESLRCEAHDLTLQERKLIAQEEEVRKEIRKYVEDNNLVWAKKLGW